MCTTLARGCEAPASWRVKFTSWTNTRVSTSGGRSTSARRTARRRRSFHPSALFSPVPRGHGSTTPGRRLGTCGSSCPCCPRCGGFGCCGRPTVPGARRRDEVQRDCFGFRPLVDRAADTSEAEVEAGACPTKCTTEHESKQDPIVRAGRLILLLRGPQTALDALPQDAVGRVRR